MISIKILEPNTNTNLIQHNGLKLTFYVLEGKCNFTTVYKNDKITVDKIEKEYYVIEEKVEYMLSNTCIKPCTLVIIQGLEEKEIKQLCENYTTWDSNYKKYEIKINNISGDILCLEDQKRDLNNHKNIYKIELKVEQSGTAGIIY